MTQIKSSSFALSSYCFAEPFYHKYMKSGMLTLLFTTLSFAAFTQEVVRDTIQEESQDSSGGRVKWSQMDILTRGKYGYGKGYIIDNSGQKTMCLTSVSYYQTQVHIVLNSGEKKLYEAKQVREVMQDSLHYLSDGEYFNKSIAEVNGTVICRRLWQVHGNPDVVFYYLRRPGEAEPKKIYRLAWGKILNKYFSDCPAMQAKLKAADLRYMDEEDMKTIPALYAQACRR